MTTCRPDHPSPAEMLSAHVDALDILRRCGRTFHAASLVLPPRARRELATLYAFCRLVDDCGDLVSTAPDDREAAQCLLDRVEAELAASRPRSPLVASFRDLAQQRGIPPLYARQLIDGVRSDLGAVRVGSSGELLRYAYRVASTVGLMMCRVLEVDPAGDPFAIDLGIGMQLTNIARDVREDAAADRVYLPGDWIASETVLAASRLGDGDAERHVVDAVERLLGLADRYYESAAAGMRFLPPAVRPGIRAAAANYRAIGGVIRRDPIAALRGRAYTTSAGKIGRTMVALGAAVADGLPGRAAHAHDGTLHAAVASLWHPVAAS